MDSRPEHDLEAARRFQRVAAVTTLVSLLPALGSGLFLAAAASFRLTALSDPASLIAIGPVGANLFRLGMVLDVFGYYLLLAPLALFLFTWLTPRNLGLVMLYTVAGFGYIFIGATGAIVLAAVEPPLIVAYAQATAASRETLQVVFSSFLNAVYLGLWNPLEAFLAGVWWVGIGSELWARRCRLGVVSILLGIGALLDALGRLLSFEAGFVLGVSWLVLFFFVWAAWSGLELLRHPEIVSELT